MTTRGTYLIRVRKEHDHRTACFYIPRYSCPVGASVHFEKALALKWENQVEGINFIKRFASLDGTEFIDSHEDREDILFQYIITENDKGIDVYVKENRGDFSGWRNLFDGNIYSFITQYKKTI